MFSRINKPDLLINLIVRSGYSGIDPAFSAGD